ncbi:MAG TPA: lysine--tRNA ligase [Sulfolobales archaeon]|nr:lysine--tRNA ligase [Sulfolobales archaeon]
MWAKEIEERIKKLREMGRDPYLIAYRFDVSSPALEIVSKYAYLKPGDETSDSVSVAGRVWHIRRHGKITFMDLYDNTGKIQIVVKADTLREDDRPLLQIIDKGDIIGVSGRVIKTKAGEVSILAERIEILSLSWRPIPFHEFGIRDPEQRYRERYLDILLNSRIRSAIVNLYKLEYNMRRILHEKGFVEVHTPKLQPIYGGALAKPFVTRIEALKRDAYLSIAPETYLKRLVVAGLYRVYEIAVCFRNEDIDATHYPEFVQLEIYQAFADWNDIMSLVEELVSESVKSIYGDYKVEVRSDSDSYTIDFRRPWKRIALEEAIERYGGVKIVNKDESEILEIAKSLGIEATDPRRGKILEKIFEKTAQPKINDPTFITLFPRDISPLARPYRNDPKYSERFELYIRGLEIGNGYSELNNPVLQYHFFKEEEELRKKAGRADVESHPMDKDYVRSLEYGLPPTGGVGIGLYRLSMVLSGLSSIKDVIPFIYVVPDEFQCAVELNPNLLDLYLK